MRNPILIGALIGFVGLGLLGVFGSGADAPDDIFSAESLVTFAIAGTIFGFVGAVVGGLIGIPFYLVFKNDPEQDQIEDHQGLEISGTDSVVGLWRSKNGLVIDPETAVFPARCIFTNESITHLLPFKIGQIEHSSAGPIGWVSKKTKLEFLPVSPAWMEQQSRRGRTIRLLLFLLSAGLLISGCIFNSALIGLGILSFMIAVAIPYLSGFNGRQEFYSAAFLDDGKILIPNPSKQFIAGLPELK